MEGKLTASFLKLKSPKVRLIFGVSKEIVLENLSSLRQQQFIKKFRSLFKCQVGKAGRIALATSPSYSAKSQRMEESLHGLARNQFPVKLLGVHLKFKIGLV